MAHTELDLREKRTIEDMLNAKVPDREMASVSRASAIAWRNRTTR